MNQESNKHIFVTAAIPYVNGAPHIGHAVEFTQVDAYARYYRKQLGDDFVMATTGSDENSLKNVRAAEEVGADVEAFVAEKAEVFKSLFTPFNLSFNDFIRTREERHMKGAQRLWKLISPDDIYQKEYEGLYCVGCEQFYTIEECPDGTCPTHKKPLEAVKETNYFFKLSNYGDKLLELIESGKMRVFPEGKRNEMVSFIKQGLEDFSISRSVERARNFGVPVPGDESQVMYVWVDALSNYINVLGFGEDSEMYRTFWEHAQKRTHIIGKDIARFHVVYWPAILLSAGLPVPTDVYVHGFFTMDGEKMSKSLGNTIDPFEFAQEYGTDAARYILLREMPHANDGDLSKQRMEERYAELANRLGNLVSRVAAMSVSYFEGKLDRIAPNWTEQNTELAHLIEDCNFKGYIDYVFEAVNQANEIVDKEQPFKLVKENPEDAKRVLSEVAEIIRWVGEVLSPIMPETSEKILAQYQESGLVTKGDALFPRRD